MTEADYRADKRMNVSLLVHGLTSMKHLRSEQLEPGGQSPAMRRGSMVHCFILQPAEFERRYVRMPRFELDAENCSGKGKNRKQSTSKATSYYKSRVAEFEEENVGAEVIEATDLSWCERIHDAIYAAPEAREILEACEWEVPLFGEIEGLGTKALLDLLGGSIYADIKTAASVIPSRFGASAARLHYAHKMAWYREHGRMNGYPIDDVKFIAVESDKPHDVVVMRVPDIVLDNAMDQLRPLVRNYARCLADDVWPGISGGKEVEMVVPPWSMPEDDELVEWKETE